MRLLEQFRRIEYDAAVSKIPVTFLYFITAIIVLFLQWNKGVVWQQLLAFIANIAFFSTFHWYSVELYEKMKSFYFALQGVLIIGIVIAVPQYTIIILITFGAILVVQSFYFYNRLSQFLIFLCTYLTYGSFILYFAYGLYELGFYIFVYFFALVLVFLILMIFNQKELDNLALVAANKRIEQLTRQNERQRMARDLHDSLIQRLIALNLKVDVVEAHLKKERYEKAEQVIVMAKNDVVQSIAEARQVVDDLRLQFEHLTVEEQILEEVQQLQFMFQLPIACTIHWEHKPSQYLTEQLIAIIKEAVTNTHKHANATKMTITIGEHDQKYKLQIADNGVGMDIALALFKEKHYGLLGMQERVALFGGHFQLRGDCGTTIIIQIPIEVE